MDTNRLNQWLTLGANVGVLVGIILILIELDQNSDLMRAQIAQTRADNQIASQEARMHSDYWPAIVAKIWDGNNTNYSLIVELSPEEQARVFYFYLREMNDLRNQFYQLQEGFLPRIVWDTSSRGQIVRAMTIGAALRRTCNDDIEFRNELNRVASEEGVSQCISDGIWE